MRIRNYNPSDYPEIASWWTAHGVACVPKEHLPVGFVAEDNQTLVAAVWAYRDPCAGWAMLAWFVTNPHLSPIVNESALEHLVTSASEVLKGETPIINAMTDRPSLKRWLARNGFTPSAENLSGFIKRAA